MLKKHITERQHEAIVTEPGLWDVYLSTGDYHSMELELEQSPLGRVRLAQLLFYRGSDHLDRAAELLAGVEDVFAPVRGMRLMLLAQRGLYSEIMETEYKPFGSSRLHIEELAWAHTAMGTAATELGLLPTAYAHLTSAVDFAHAAGMGRHAEHVKSNALRLGTLCGVADLDGLWRHATREGQQPATQAWNASLLAEGYASYGNYAQALSVIAKYQDADSEAQRAWYTLLRLGTPLPLSPEAQRTGYGRLSEAFMRLQRGRSDFDLLDLYSEPERSYGRLLTAAAELGVPDSGAQTAARLLADETYDLPDQRVLATALQLRAASLGAQLERPAELLGELRSTLDLMEKKGSAHAVLRLLSLMSTTLLLLAMVPDPHPLLRPWIRQIAQLCGSTVRWQNHLLTMPAGESDGWGRHLVCEALEMFPPEDKLRRFARARYEDKLLQYQKADPWLPARVVNLGVVAQTYLRLRKQASDDGAPAEAAR